MEPETPGATVAPPIAKKCDVCRGYYRPPETPGDREELWSLCRATGGNIMCPHFTADHPGNSGWEAEARRRFRPLEQVR